MSGRHGSLPLADFLQIRANDACLARLTHNIPLPEARGLEFGAGNAPTLLPEGHWVEYVDYHAQPEGADAGWAPIDHVWAGAGSLAAICPAGRTYTFAIAGQVAQYVPNLLGWLRGIFDVLETGGVLNLSLPDHRFTVDCNRRRSTIAEAVEAFLLDFSRPSPRQFFEHIAVARKIDRPALWREETALAEMLRLDGQSALNVAYRQCQHVFASDRYVPCHCWVFSPLSFLSLIEEATRLGLFPFVFNQFCMTEPGDFRFFVSLRRDSETDPGRRMCIQLDAIAYLRNVAERQVQRARRTAQA